MADNNNLNSNDDLDLIDLAIDEVINESNTNSTSTPAPNPQPNPQPSSVSKPVSNTQYDSLIAENALLKETNKKLKNSPSNLNQKKSKILIISGFSLAGLALASTLALSTVAIVRGFNDPELKKPHEIVLNQKYQNLFSLIIKDSNTQTVITSAKKGDLVDITVEPIINQSNSWSTIPKRLLINNQFTYFLTPNEITSPNDPQTYSSKKIIVPDSKTMTVDVINDDTELESVQILAQDSSILEYNHRYEVDAIPGETLQLKAVLYPTITTNVVWSTSNTSLVSIDQNGLLTVKKTLEDNIQEQEITISATVTNSETQQTKTGQKTILLKLPYIHSNKFYTYDSETKEWKILEGLYGTGFDPLHPEQEAHHIFIYSLHDRTEYSEVLRSKFNKPVFIGSEITTISSYFLCNCYNFNSQLTFGNTTNYPSKVTSILDSFLDMCSCPESETPAFNQPLTLPPNLEYIGESFLSMALNFNNGTEASKPWTEEYDFILPKKLKIISSAFLGWCSMFNHPITIPSSVLSIGQDFLYSCTAFNKPLIFEDNSNCQQLGRSFLGACTSFNQPLSIPRSVVDIQEEFLILCNSLTEPITLAQTVEDNFWFDEGLSFIVSNLDSQGNPTPAYTQGMTIFVNSERDKNILIQNFPNTSTNPEVKYRNINVLVKV